MSENNIPVDSDLPLDFSGVMPDVPVENPLSFEVWLAGQDDETQALVTNHVKSLIAEIIEAKTEMAVFKDGVRDMVETRKSEIEMFNQILNTKPGSDS
jgi:hypothetical protein